MIAVELTHESIVDIIITMIPANIAPFNPIYIEVIIPCLTTLSASESGIVDKAHILIQLIIMSKKQARICSIYKIFSNLLSISYHINSLEHRWIKSWDTRKKIEEPACNQTL